MDRFKGLKIGLQSITLRKHDLQGVVERLKDLGLRYVDLSKKHLAIEAPDAEIERVKKLCADNGIEIDCVAVGILTADVEKNRPVFEFAKKLGVKVMMANPMHDSMDALDQLVDQYQIKVGIHNHGPTSTWPDIETIDKHIQGHSPLIGLCVDTGHFTRVPVDPVKALHHFKERVYAVHLKDIDKDENGQHGKEHIVGDGPLDLRAVMQIFRQWNFQGPISIEYETDTEETMGDLRVALDRIEKALA
ncbi:MAG: sugar phosphate isomerase/epimerase [Candidatus Sumerlaeota bacterium]|nr:sugar phosphate isomerase/epimerase [Candidatus Sumerlaeota bacterium]